MEYLAYLIPASLVVFLVTFPILLWLSRKKNQ